LRTLKKPGVCFGISGSLNPILEPLWHHDTSDQLFDAFNEGAVRATAMLRSQPDEAREKIRTVVRSEVEQLREGDHYVISVPAALSWARKP
jgi:hypothetical protein